VNLTPNTKFIWNGRHKGILQPYSLHLNTGDIQTTREELKTQYVTAINRLTDIINMPDPSQANVATLKAMANAIKDIAIIERRHLKIFVNIRN